MLDDVKAVAEMFGISVEPLEVTDPSGKNIPSLMLKDQHIAVFDMGNYIVMRLVISLSPEDTKRLEGLPLPPRAQILFMIGNAAMSDHRSFTYNFDDQKRVNSIEIERRLLIRLDDLSTVQTFIDSIQELHNAALKISALLGEAFGAMQRSEGHRSEDMSEEERDKRIGSVPPPDTMFG